MKKLFTLLSMTGALTAAQAQHYDTLVNHANNLTLQAGRYTMGGEWGFYAGHNSFEQQQFGEKYMVNGHVEVLGVIAHLATASGTVSDPDFEIDFRVWEADKATGKPSGNNSLEDGHLDLGDANLNGPTVVMFHNEAPVDDAFFVTMDLGDYAHHGLSGDTVGLYYAPHGSRSASDIANVSFRNVFQAHGHGAPDWKDFYAQFTTPTQIATHLALYPIVEIHATSIGDISRNNLQIKAPYPNPSDAGIFVPYTLKKQTEVRFHILDINGKMVGSVHKGHLKAGDYNERIDISTLSSGTYFLSLITNEDAIALKINKL